jgi:hypothetical protein
MQANIHFRDPNQKTMALCGQGYLWPSTIPLRNVVDEVTCQPCLSRLEVRRKRNGASWPN